MAKQLEKKHPLAIRWLHWISFPLLTLMIWRGLLIYWANAVFGVNIFGYELFHFFPAQSMSENYSLLRRVSSTNY